MKNLFLLSSWLINFAVFAQKADLTKKEAFEAYKKSEFRILYNLSLEDFNFHYKKALCVQKHYVNDFVLEIYPATALLSTMPIFSKKLDREQLFLDFPFGLYGYGERIPPKDDYNRKSKCF